MRRIVVGISGASGAAYAVELCAALGACADVEPHLIVTPTASDILERECGVDCPASAPDVRIFGQGAARAAAHDIGDLHASIASGSFRFEGMVVIPCSMGRLAAFASGIVRDLMDRAAEVAMKEGRTLLLVPRETPLSVIHLENMTRLARAGAVVMPAAPGFYFGTPECLPSTRDLVQFMTARVMDRLGLPFDSPRWEGR